MEEKEKIDCKKIRKSVQKKKDSVTNGKTIKLTYHCNIDKVFQIFIQSKIEQYIAPLKKQIEKLEQKMTELKQENSELEQENSEIKEKFEKLEQENSEIKEKVEKLKSQNQQLQNNFDLLLGILSQQNPKLKDQFQGLLGASGDIGADTSKGQGYTFK